MVSAAGDGFGLRRTSVTGTMLSNYVNRDVRLIGNVIRSDPVDSFAIDTGDGVTINVKLSNMLDEAVEGLVDVRGRVANRNTVEACTFMCFNKDQAAAFDIFRSCNVHWKF